MVILQNFVNIFFIPELRRKLLFTLGILAVYRLGNFIPLIGIDLASLAQFMQQPGALSDFFSYWDMISGGSLSRYSLFALGISPYVSASIVMQLLSLSIPTLELLLKEGEYGRKIINQYTRYLALVISVVQSAGVILIAERAGFVIDPGWGFRILSILLLTVGSMFVMWLGEQISLYGVGNGSSMIIFAGIVARFPSDISRTIEVVHTGVMSISMAMLILAIVVAITCCIVYLEKGERKIPVQYTRRIVGNRVYGGQGAFIPFRINNAGVLPVIYSNAVLSFPRVLASFLASRFPVFKTVAEAFMQTGLLFNVLDFILIVCFSFLYMTIQFNPEELADNMKKSGGVIPGVRPGRKTAEFFNHLLMRLGLVGAVYLAGLAIIPNIVQAVLRLPVYLSVLSGTGLLILVGVALELAAQVEAYLLESRYQGFLTTGRFKARGAR